MCGARWMYRALHQAAREWSSLDIYGITPRGPEYGARGGYFELPDAAQNMELARVMFRRRERPDFKGLATYAAL